MRTFSKFTLVAAATLGVAFVGAVASALGFERVGLAACNVALMSTAILVFLADRRRRAQAKRDQRESRGVLISLEEQSRRVEVQVDMMQRRVIAALETARLEEADRARDGVNGAR